MRSLVIVATSLPLLMAGPALAQMKTSAPAGAAAGATPATAAAAAGYRPTSIFGVERAQVLDAGTAVMGLSGIDLSAGFGNNLELGLTGPLTLGIVPGGLTLPTLNGKMLLIGGPSMSLGVAASLGLSSLSAGVGVPISLWRLGPGDLHVVPGINLGFAGAFSSSLGGQLAYEMPMPAVLPGMAKWSLAVTDTLGLTMAPTFGMSNTIGLGSRIPLSPNLTADVGAMSLGVSGTGATLTFTLFSLSGYLGGRTDDLRKMFGI